MMRLLAAAFVGATILTATAENWPQWRGPRGDGTSHEKNVSIEWSQNRNVLWKTPIPGEGHSSPAVWNNDIFLTTAAKDNGQRLLIKINAANGKIIWQKVVVTAPLEDMHRENSGASSTPVTDGRLVFTSFQNGTDVDLQCYDSDGNKVWAIRPLKFKGMHGYSYTPLLVGDLLIYDLSQNDEAVVLGLHKGNGKEKWRYKRQKQEISHVTPLLIPGARPQVVVCGGDEVRSFEPATGQSIWWAEGPTDVCVAGMAFGDDTVFVTGGYPKRLRMAIGTKGQGDVTSSQVRWKTGREVTYVPSPVFANGHLYTVVDDGMLYCFNAKTGNPTWTHRIGGRFRSSLVLANNNIYATNDKGVTTVFRVDEKKFTPIATNDLAEFCYTTPAISNSRLYLRTGGNLYCIGEGTKSAAAR